MALISDVLELLNDLKFYSLGVVVAVLIFTEWKSWHRLSAFRGPRLASVSHLWMARSLSGKQIHLDLYDVYKKYGDLARITPNMLLTSNPELLHRMSSARSEYTKSLWYSEQKFEPDQHNLISQPDEKLHTKWRAQMIHGYSNKEIPDLESIIDTHVINLVDLISRKYISTASSLRPMDLAVKAGYFTMDAITDLAFGNSWGCLTKDEDVNQWFRSIEVILSTLPGTRSMPLVKWIFSFQPIQRFLMTSASNGSGVGKVVEASYAAVNGRFDEGKIEGQNDMLGSFIRHGMVKNELPIQASLQIIAGGETTATSIRGTLLYLMTNVSAYATLQREIDSAQLAHGQIISDSQARLLPYLQAVIKEGTRMMPPFTGIAPKVVPGSGDTIDGRFVPGGTEIAVCYWGLQRSTSVFGLDSDMFRPERWLEASELGLQRMERSFSLVWGSGKYGCLGKGIGLMELNKVFFHLIKEFDFALIDPLKPMHSECYGLWLQKDLWVRVTKRRTKAE